MGSRLAVCKILRRGKCIALLLISLWVVAWITFSGENKKLFHVFYPMSLTLVSQDGTDNTVNLRTAVPEDRRTQPPKAECPQESPLLKGAVKLSFEPTLTLKDVQMENKAVAKGEYEPPDCSARQSVAILIPQRSRERHLLYLMHHLHPFLQRQQLHYAIYVIQQAGNATFNRAKLLNIGYLEALKDYSWDCFIFHDVDLVPENDRNVYVCDRQPKHFVVGRNATGYKLRYKGYFGGVTALTRDQFHQINGFSNAYWGWGGEDDDLLIRVQLQKMEIVRPPAEVARYTMVFHKRDNGNKVNKNRMKLLVQTSQVWQKDGLNSCSYKTLSLERTPLYVNITVDIGKPSS